MKELATRIEAAARRLNLQQSLVTRLVRLTDGMTADDIRRLGYAYFHETSGFGVRSLRALGHVIGEIWPPEPTVDLRPVPTRELIAELRERGYEATRREGDE